MIYLASPYSHPDPEVRQKRYEQMLDVCHWLFMKKEYPYSPIVHWHNVAERFEIQGEFATFERLDKHCIVTMPKFAWCVFEGHRDSEGMYKEFHFSTWRNKHYYLIHFYDISRDYSITPVSEEELIRFIEESRS